MTNFDSPPRLTQLRISGLRVIKDLTLDLHGLTVLIGDNGTGKSSILEALELLRMASKPVSYAQDVLENMHGGFRSLLRHGAEALQLGCNIHSEKGTTNYDIGYDLEIQASGHVPFIAKETATSDFDDAVSKPLTLFRESPGTDKRTALALLSFYSLRKQGLHDIEFSHPTLEEGIANIEIHVPFETRPLWQQKELDLRTGPRWPSVVESTNSLSRYAINLANAFQELRNRGNGVWQRVVDRSRLGIRDDLRDFRISAYGRGQVELEVVFGNTPDKPMPVEYLSEGQLTYLAMVALCELAKQSSVLAFDEPEVHLHPSLLARVVFMLEELAQTVPVVIATHSDRLLDCLSNPAASVVLCDLDEDGATRLRRPNKEALDKWLEDYRGVGSLRAEGYTDHLFDEPSEKEQGPRS